MANFHHHPQGNIYIRTNSGVYLDTLENFNKDLLAVGIVAYEGLPQDCIERFFDPNGRKYVIEADYDQRGDESFTSGDLYIEKYNELVIAKEARGKEVEIDPNSISSS
jgi:hypothetical protein